MTQFSIHDSPPPEPPENPDEVRAREEAMADRLARDEEVCGLCGTRRDQHTGLKSYCPRYAARFVSVTSKDMIEDAVYPKPEDNDER